MTHFWASQGTLEVMWVTDPASQFELADLTDMMRLWWLTIPIEDYTDATLAIEATFPVF